jgi:uncharacterized protein (DUF1330 family)
MAEIPTSKPAYLISSMRLLQPERLGPFRQAAGPLTTKAGAEPLGAGDPSLRVLEGRWDHEGSILVIERYPSMEGLLAFWNSPEFQEAKRLAAGLVHVNFVVAIEGR